MYISNLLSCGAFEHLNLVSSWKYEWVAKCWKCVNFEHFVHYQTWGQFPRKHWIFVKVVCVWMRKVKAIMSLLSVLLYFDVWMKETSLLWKIGRTYTYICCDQWVLLSCFRPHTHAPTNTSVKFDTSKFSLCVLTCHWYWWKTWEPAKFFITEPSVLLPLFYMANEVPRKLVFCTACNLFKLLCYTPVSIDTS